MSDSHPGSRLPPGADPDQGITASIASGGPDAAAEGDQICYWIRDLNDQPLPAGTEIRAEVSNSKIVGPSSYTVPSTTDDSEDGNTYCFSINEGTISDPATGNLFLEIEVPSGLVTYDSRVVINDPSP